MYTSSDLKKGLKIEIDGNPYAVVEFSFLKPGKGQAVYTCRLKNLTTGATMVRNFRSNDKIDECNVEEKELTFSYAAGENYVFLDANYEEVTLPESLLGNKRFFLLDDMKVVSLFHNGAVIDVAFPNFVEKEIIYTEPGLRGDTATNVFKQAQIEGGYEIHVPLFINQGDIVRIDTRTGDYADRVSTK